jgi:ArsR family transcriptional regulator
MRIYADIFKALADETRLTIISLLLRHGELCVCDVEAVLNISQSKASRHLRYLKHAGLIDDRRKGIWVYYRISDEKKTAAAKVLQANSGLIASLANSTIEKRLKNWLKDKECFGFSCVKIANNIANNKKSQVIYEN